MDIYIYHLSLVDPKSTTIVVDYYLHAFTKLSGNYLSLYGCNQSELGVKHTSFIRLYLHLKKNKKKLIQIV